MSSSRSTVWKKPSKIWSIWRPRCRRSESRDKKSLGPSRLSFRPNIHQKETRGSILRTIADRIVRDFLLQVKRRRPSCQGVLEWWTARMRCTRTTWDWWSTLKPTRTQFVTLLKALFQTKHIKIMKTQTSREKLSLLLIFGQLNSQARTKAKSKHRLTVTAKLLLTPLAISFWRSTCLTLISTGQIPWLSKKQSRWPMRHAQATTLVKCSWIQSRILLNKKKNA